MNTYFKMSPKVDYFDITCRFPASDLCCHNINKPKWLVLLDELFNEQNDNKKNDIARKVLTAFLTNDMPYVISNQLAHIKGLEDQIKELKEKQNAAS